LNDTTQKGRHRPPQKYPTGWSKQSEYSSRNTQPPSSFQYVLEQAVDVVLRVKQNEVSTWRLRGAFDKWRDFSNESLGYDSQKDEVLGDKRHTQNHPTQRNNNNNSKKRQNQGGHINGGGSHNHHKMQIQQQRQQQQLQTYQQQLLQQLEHLQQVQHSQQQHQPNKTANPNCTALYEFLEGEWTLTKERRTTKTGKTLTTGRVKFAPVQGNFLGLTYSEGKEMGMDLEEEGEGVEMGQTYIIDASCWPVKIIFIKRRPNPHKVTLHTLSLAMTPGSRCRFENTYSHNCTCSGSFVIYNANTIRWSLEIKVATNKTTVERILVRTKV
jgi:hypothetical protein